MNWWTKWLQRLTNSTAQNPASWFVEWIRGSGGSDSGVPVNGKSALQWAPLWYGINKIAGHVAQLPCDLREQIGDRQSRLMDSHPSYWLMNYEPNEMMVPSVFREVMQHHALAWGNGRAAIYRNARSEPAELIPLLPDRTNTVIVNGEKWHVHRDAETGEVTRFRDNDVLHICGFGFDGLQGYSLIEFARNSIGLGLAAEKHVSKHFKNNATPSLVLEAPPGMFRSEADAKEFLRNWHDYYQGVDNSNKVGLLREGMKATPLAGLSGRDAQWLEERQFQRQEAALWLLLEQILGDNSSVSYNSLEQKNMGYLVNCLMRWLVKWEEEMARKLLTRTQFESGRLYWKFKVAALLRGTTSERYAVYQIGLQNRILNPNEVRAMEDMPPYEGGDEYGNPSITPGAPGRGQPATDDGSYDEDAAVQAMAGRFEPLARVERQRLCQGAEKHAKRFCQWLDEFYTGFRPRLVQAMQDVSAADSYADEWIEETKRRTLDAAGRARLDTLRSVIAEEVTSWTTPKIIAQRIQEDRHAENRKRVPALAVARTQP